MAPRDNRITALLGGVTASVGHSEHDINTLQHRREQSAKMLRDDPEVSFAEVLRADEKDADAKDGKKDPEQSEADGAALPAEDDAAGPQAKGPTLPRGKGRLIRG